VLKLRYLFGNTDLAAMLLGNWEHDRPADQLFGSFRISANAVYPFLRNAERCFLRFSPLAEKSLHAIAAELAFLSYLRGNGFPAAEPLPARSGELALCGDTPWGPYCACAFKGVPGRPLDAAPVTTEQVCRLGGTLGKLHALSRAWPSCAGRPTHADVLDRIEGVLKDLGHQERALTELTLVREHLCRFSKSPGSYGLIHYDFETDNVFLDEASGTISVIDFDDAMYHWYGMDLEQAIDSLADAVPGQDVGAVKAVFLEGYKRESPVAQLMLEHLPAFRRFASLFGYARIARSVAETWQNEPEWMQALRQKLAAGLSRRCADFGRPIV
jgi:Ser/Thr protein kinase RdoA (MazF antagonist)